MKYTLETLKKAYSIAKSAQKITLGMDIQKFDEEQRMVWGYASTEMLDCQGEIVSSEAMKNAWSDYMAYGNIREMHTNSAVGVVKSYEFRDEGVFIGVKVVDDSAWSKVKEGVYKAFSIGGAIVEKVGNTIKSLILNEISLVDRGANPGAVITLFKMADDLSDLDENKEPEVSEEIVKSLQALTDSGFSLEEIVSLVKKSKEEKDEVEKANKDALIAKGFYEIKDIINVIDILSWVLDDKEWEAKWKNDDNSEVLTALREHIISITALAQTMLTNEIKDLTGVSDSVVELNAKIEDIVKFKVEKEPVVDDTVEKLNNLLVEKETISKSLKESDDLIKSKDAEIQSLKDKIEVLNKNAIFENKNDLHIAKKEIKEKAGKEKTMVDIKKDVGEEIATITDKLTKCDDSEKKELNERLTVLKLKQSQLSFYK